MSEATPPATARVMSRRRLMTAGAMVGVGVPTIGAIDGVFLSLIHI